MNRTTIDPSAKHLLLDVLRATEPDALPVRMLVEIGRLFNISGNAVRVNLARLVSQRRLEKDDHGFYRAARETHPLREFVERWRLGEHRVRSWNSHWLGLSLGESLSMLARKPREAIEKSLALSGFRPLNELLFVRPDNLAESLEATRHRLGKMGLELQHCLFKISELSDSASRQWRRLWDVETLNQSYKAAYQALRQSQARLPRMTEDQALVECFTAGGEAIRILATDPLLPEDWIDWKARSRLTELMVEYDQMGRDRWQRFLDRQSLPRSPQLITSLTV